MMASMRSKIVLCCLLCLVPAPALAVEAMTWGIKGGLVLSNVSPKEFGPFIELEDKMGPHGGAFANWGLNELLSFQVEALYASKGYSYGGSFATDEIGNPLGTYEALQVVDYIETPLLLKLVPSIGDRVRPFFLGGLAPSFKVAEKFKTTGSLESSDDTDGFEGTDIGATGGVGVQIRTGPGLSLIEARYTQGLVDVAKDDQRDIKNRVFVFSVGYTF